LDINTRRVVGYVEQLGHGHDDSAHEVAEREADLSRQSGPLLLSEDRD